MTYWKTEWDLYVCRFIILTKTFERTNKGIIQLDESYYITTELFKSNNPEEAYSFAVSTIQRLNNGYRNEEGQEVSEECLGINDIDLLQENLVSLEKILDSNQSLTIDTFSGKELQKTPYSLVKEKTELSLFNHNPNYETT